MSHFLQELAGFADGIGVANAYIDLSAAKTWRVFAKTLRQELNLKEGIRKSLAKKVKSRESVILLFDSIDRASPRLLTEIEERIIPLGLTGQVLVYLGGRAPHHLRRLEHRKRTIFREIGPLGIEETRDQLGELGNITEEVFGVSHGYPLANLRIAEMVKAGTYERKKAIAVVAKEILERTTASPILRDLVLVLSTLRIVDAALLRMICRASGMFPGFPEDTFAYGGYLPIFGYSGVVRWRDAKTFGYYEVQEPIRQILQDCLVEYNRDLYKKLHLAALRKFAEWVAMEEVELELRIRYLGEASYHADQLGE